MASSKRILVFGSTGQGKSALINTLLGSVQAPMGDAATGVTRQRAEYYHRHGGANFCFVDNSGMNEDKCGGGAGAEAYLALRALVQDCVDRGYNLAIMVHRGRVTDAAFKGAYDLFVETLFSLPGDSKTQLPVILVKTGCEDNMDEWLKENADQLMDTAGYDGFAAVLPACCAHGKPGSLLEAAVYSGQRKETAARVWKAVELHALPEPVRLQGHARLLLSLWNKVMGKVNLDWRVVSKTVLDSLLKMGLPPHLAEQEAVELTEGLLAAAEDRATIATTRRRQSEA